LKRRWILGSLAFVFLLSLPVFYTNCGNVFFNPNSYDGVVGNPMNPTQASQEILFGICSVLNRCQQVPFDTCMSGVSATSGIAQQLGLPAWVYGPYSSIESAENSGAISATLSAENTCADTINNLSCTNSNVQNAYNSSSSNPFGAVLYMVPLASCGQVFTPPVQTNSCTSGQISSWAFGDGGGTTGINYNTGQNAINPSATVLGSDLYVSWAEFTGQQNVIHSKYSDGQNWNSADSGSGITYGHSDLWPEIFSYGSNILVLFGENPALAYQARAQIYGGGTNWNAADTGTLNEGSDYVSPFLYDEFSLSNLGGQPYLAFGEHNTFYSSEEVRAEVYNGATSWSFIDGGGNPGLNFDPTEVGGDPQLINFNGKVYATWYEGCGAPTYCIRAKVYQGNSNWAFVDGDTALGNITYADRSYEPTFGVFNNKLYVAWQENDGSGVFQIRVKVYNGNDSNPVWTSVDGNGPEGLNRNTANIAQAPKLTAFNCQLYMTWEETNGVNTQIRVAVYNGNDAAPNWSFVDGGSATSGINYSSTMNAHDPNLIVFNNALYVTWYENNASGFTQIRVAHGQ
jgi:hypothetical protein